MSIFDRHMKGLAGTWKHGVAADGIFFCLGAGVGLALLGVVAPTIAARSVLKEVFH